MGVYNPFESKINEHLEDEEPEVLSLGENRQDQVQDSFDRDLQ